ncbi:MAG: hypothetical protein R6X25_10680 [Candidatus Krumholzibacteriia bacterium]
MSEDTVSGRRRCGRRGCGWLGRRRRSGDAPRTSARTASASAAAVLLVLGFSTGPVTAQVPYLDPLPWLPAFGREGRPALELGIGRFQDPSTGWAAGRIRLQGLLGSGPNSAAFVRVSYLSFDSDGLRVFERWPALLALEDEDAAAWPHEDRVAGLGRTELGVLTSLRVPLVRTFRVGLAAGLPIGNEETYPFGGASVPLRVDLRKQWTLGGRAVLAVTGGGMLHLDSAADELDPGAYPGGWHAGADLVLNWRERRFLVAAYDRWNLDGRLSERVGGELWWPSGGFDAVGLVVEHELTGPDHRAAQTYLGVVVRLVQRPAAETDRPAASGTVDSPRAGESRPATSPTP